MIPYAKLTVWVDAHALVLHLYALTDRFPARERYGLTSQLRRAVVSIAANIVEGSKRNSDRDFGHFINIALGSAAEVEYLLGLCRDLGLIETNQATSLLREADSLQRRLYNLRHTLFNGPARRSK